MSKKRKIRAVRNYPGIYENLVLDEETGKWKEPVRGAKYLVARPGRGSGKRREWESFDTFAEAKAFRSRASTPFLTSPLVETEKERGLTLEELIEEWMANWVTGLAITTQSRYPCYVKHYEYLKKMYVEEIQPTDIDRWIAHIKTPEYLAGPHHSTRCNYEHEYWTLRSIFKYYVRRKNRNYRLPFVEDHVDMLKVKERKKVELDLTVKQVRKFMEVLRQDVFGTRYEVIFYVAVMQYLIYGRIQDAAALQYESFDFESGRIRVENKVQWVPMETRVSRGSKTDDGKHIVMSDFAASFFREWTIRTGIRSGHLFLFDGKVVSYRRIKHRYDKAFRNAGLPFTGTHILRHASLTEYYDGCKDLLATAKVAGHSDTRTTTRYAKARSETLMKNQLQMDVKLSSLKDLQMR